CPIEAFCINVRGTPRSPWNVSASRVFIKHLTQKHDFPDNSVVRQRIEHAFFTRVKGLHASWNASVKSPSEAKGDLARGRSYQRKKTDFDRRKEMVHKYKNLHKFVGVLDALGIAGMSSDESDSSLGQKTYTITRPQWRSAEFRRVMGTLDVIYSLTRSAKARSDARGQHVRRRKASEKVSTRTVAPKRLPINFY
ncbi:hypothetical protein DENSPDRAFT_758508, partial [Dentipellis sp. KUC8613]